MIGKHPFIYIVLVLTFQITAADAQWNRIDGLYGGPVNQVITEYPYLYAVSENSFLYRLNYTESNDSQQWEKLLKISTFAVQDSLILAVFSNNATINNQHTNLALSTDYGITWNAVPGGDTLSGSTVAINDSIIFIGSRRGLYRSSDIGQSWKRVTDIHADRIYNWNGIYIGEKTDYAITNNTVYRSTDNGVSWSIIGDQINDPLFMELAHHDSTVFVGTLDSLYISTDYGLTWNTKEGLRNLTVNTLPPPITSLRYDGNRLFVNNRNGKLFRSTDRGSSWDSVNLHGAEINYFSIDTVNSTPSGNFSIAASTHEKPGILTGALNDTELQPIQNLAGFSGISVEHFEMYEESTNTQNLNILAGIDYYTQTQDYQMALYQGKNRNTSDRWAKIQIDSSSDQRAVHLLDAVVRSSNANDNYLLALLDINTNYIYQYDFNTTDTKVASSNSWEKSTKILIEDLSVYQHQVYAVGDTSSEWRNSTRQNKVMTELDHGSRWEIISEIDAEEPLVELEVTGNGYFSRTDYNHPVRVYHTTHPDSNWTTIFERNANISNLVITDSLLLIGAHKHYKFPDQYENGIFYSTNIDKSWKQVFPDRSVEQLMYQNNMIFFLENSDIYFTDTTFRSPTNVTKSFDEFIDHFNIYNDTLYASTNTGIWKSALPDTQFTGTERLSSSNPNQFELHQNYPNPFNPSTTIRYNLATKAHVQLKIYDSLGRLVQVLVDARKIAGSYSARFKAENLSSGLYFYQLKTDNFSKTRKMLFLK